MVLALACPLRRDGTIVFVRIVLVHGTTQSPDGWARLTQALVAMDHEVDAVDLAGVDPHRSMSKEYAAAAVDQVPGGRADVVVAHSGTGLLLPAIASTLSADRQVYLAALIPDGTRSFLDEDAQQGSTIVHEDWSGVDPTEDHDAARHFLFHDCDDRTVEWALTTLRRFVPTAVYTEVVQPVDVPAIVVVPRSDRTIRASWMTEAARDRLGVEPIMLPGGHCPHVSRPNDVANIVNAAVTQP